MLDGWKELGKDTPPEDGDYCVLYSPEGGVFKHLFYFVKDEDVDDENRSPGFFTDSGKDNLFVRFSGENDFYFEYFTKWKVVDITGPPGAD